jgi:hypothetical protein
MLTPAGWRIIRDVIIVTVGSVLLLHEALISMEPNALVIGAGLALLGVPPILRFDERNGSGR